MLLAVGGALCVLGGCGDSAADDPRPQVMNVQSGTAPTPVVTYRSLAAGRKAAPFPLLAPAYLPRGVYPEPYVLIDRAGVEPGRNGIPGVEIAYYSTSTEQALSLEEYSPTAPAWWRDAPVPGSASGLDGQETAEPLPQGPAWVLLIPLDPDSPLSLTNQIVRIRFRQNGVAAILSATRLDHDEVVRIAASVR
ncbi:MAG TPA: hypothetical protein VKY74_24825 [Chloroflexia bacterium]|nr:hypothetical protein [Chloroflexia bacterium]